MVKSQLPLVHMGQTRKLTLRMLAFSSNFRIYYLDRLHVLKSRQRLWDSNTKLDFYCHVHIPSFIQMAILKSKEMIKCFTTKNKIHWTSSPAKLSVKISVLEDPVEENKCTCELSRLTWPWGTPVWTARFQSTITHNKKLWNHIYGPWFIIAKRRFLSSA